MSQSHSQPKNVQPLEQTGTGYQHAQAVGKVQFIQPHDEEVGIERDDQRSPQGIRAQNSVDRVSPVEVNDGDMDTFQDWLEQFEMIAGVYGWSLQAKLVNLVTRLQGQVYAFFRSCTTQQKTSYALLVAELHKRFTPVHF